MNKNLLITLIAIGALALFVFYFSNHKAPSVKENTQMVKAESATIGAPVPLDATPVTGSLNSLMSEGKNVVCTFATDQNGMNITGLVHVSGSKMNGTFDVTVAEMAMASHMISDGTWMYTWTDGSDQGMKMNLKAMQESAAMDHSGTMDVTSQNSNLENLQQQYNFSCSPWVPDVNAFTLPEGVTFSEL